MPMFLPDLPPPPLETQLLYNVPGLTHFYEHTVIYFKWDKYYNRYLVTHTLFSIYNSSSLQLILKSYIIVENCCCNFKLKLCKAPFIKVIIFRKNKLTELFEMKWVKWTAKIVLFDFSIICSLTLNGRNITKQGPFYGFVGKLEGELCSQFA